MKLSTLVRFAAAAAVASALGAAHAQGPAAEPEGYAFGCTDGSKLVLDFVETGNDVAAMVSVHGVTYRLPYIAPEPGPVQIVWSDGEHSLTWSPGVQLMWMARNTHLMCSRSGGHKH
jgi:hypothetical protein